MVTVSLTATDYTDEHGLILSVFICVICG